MKKFKLQLAGFILILLLVNQGCAGFQEKSTGIISETIQVGNLSDVCLFIMSRKMWPTTPELFLYFMVQMARQR